MKRPTVKVVPEESEVPEAPPFPMDEQEEGLARQRIKEQFAKPLWVAGRKYKCPTCRHKSLVGSDALHFEFPKGNVIYSYRKLAGAKCTNCAAQFLEPSSLMDIEGDLIGSYRSDYEAKVTSIGNASLGTYWPRDLVRLLGFRKDRRLFIEVLDSKTALLKVI